MARYSLHLAVNTPDRSHYGTSVRSLAFAEADAVAWHHLALDHGFDAWPPLIGPSATTSALREWVISKAAHAGRHQFLITWSGHGTQVASDTGLDKHDDDDRTGSDHLDETWVMYDRLLLDDEIYGLMCEFSADAQVIVVADSCHSHTVLRIDESPLDVEIGEGLVTPRYVPEETAQRLVAKRHKEYAAAVSALDRDRIVRADVVGLVVCLVIG